MSIKGLLNIPELKISHKGLLNLRFQKLTYFMFVKILDNIHN